MHVACYVLYMMRTYFVIIVVDFLVIIKEIFTIVVRCVSVDVCGGCIPNLSLVLDVHIGIFVFW